MGRYEKVTTSEWIRPKRRGYRMSCCDCGLVHELDFALIPWGRGKKIILRARRHEKDTAFVRQRMKRKGEL